MLTHHAPDTPVPGVTFVGELGSAVAAARAAAGEKYVNVLGAEVARQCLDAGVLDEILVCIAPVLLGDGLRFSAALARSLRLDERKQIRVDLVLVRRTEAVRSARVDFECRPVD